ncbi:MAG: hypothetical protein ACR2NE_07535 [Pirellulales bacterium]
MIRSKQMRRRIDAAVVAVRFLVRLLVFVHVVHSNIVRNVVSVVVPFPRILHDYVELVPTNTARSVLFVAELSQKKLGDFVVDVRANIKWAAVDFSGHERRLL